MKLVCASCESTVDVDPTKSVGGKPVLQWFADQYARCTTCYQNTSASALRAALPKVGTKRAIVLDAIMASGGLTDEEMQRRIPMSPNTQRPRRLELVKAHLVIDSGQRRRTFSGELAVVWIATHHADKP